MTMTRFYVYFLLCIILISSCKQRIERDKGKLGGFSESKVSTGELKFITSRLNFGAVPKDSLIKGTFVFTNTGSGTLIIDNVEPDCSCTSAHLSKKTLMPKDTASIVLTVDTHKKMGDYELNSTVTANTHTHIYMLSLFFKVK